MRSGTLFVCVVKSVQTPMHVTLLIDVQIQHSLHAILYLPPSLSSCHRSSPANYGENGHESNREAEEGDNENAEK